VVDEVTMPVVHRIFRIIGEDGSSIRRVKHTLERGGVPVPSGNSGKLGWETTFIRHLVLNDIYKPHTHAEIAELVSPDVAATLDKQESYGVWWFNRERIVRRRIVEHGENGREYRYSTKRVPRPNSEWIAVPVPDAGVP
jgi:hypothetical protein